MKIHDIHRASVTFGASTGRDGRRKSAREVRCQRDIFQVSRYDVKANGVGASARVSVRQSENTVFRVAAATANCPSLKYAEGGSA